MTIPMDLLVALDQLRKAVRYHRLPEIVEVTADERRQIIALCETQLITPPIPYESMEQIGGLTIDVCEHPTKPDIPERVAFRVALAEATRPHECLT